MPPPPASNTGKQKLQHERFNAEQTRSMGAYSTFKALFTVENGGGKNWNTSGLLWFPGLNRPRGGGASERSKATQCHLADVIWKTWRGDWKEFYRHFNGEKPLSAELAKVLTG